MTVLSNKSGNEEVTLAWLKSMTSRKTELSFSLIKRLKLVSVFDNYVLS